MDLRLLYYELRTGTMDLRLLYYGLRTGTTDLRLLYYGLRTGTTDLNSDGARNRQFDVFINITMCSTLNKIGLIQTFI